MKSFDDLVLDSINVPNDVYPPFSPSRLLPFRVVVFRRWIDDGGEAEVLIVFLHLFFFPFRVSCCVAAHLRAHTDAKCCVCVCECVYNPRRSDRACVCKSERVCTLFMSFRVSSLLSSLQQNNKKSPDLHMDALLAPGPLPLLCDFSWQFVSLNV